MCNFTINGQTAVWLNTKVPKGGMMKSHPLLAISMKPVILSRHSFCVIWQISCSRRGGNIEKNLYKQKVNGFLICKRAIPHVFCGVSAMIPSMICCLSPAGITLIDCPDCQSAYIKTYTFVYHWCWWFGDQNVHSAFFFVFFTFLFMHLAPCNKVLGFLLCVCHSLHFLPEYRRSCFCLCFVNISHECKRKCEGTVTYSFFCCHKWIFLLVLQQQQSKSVLNKYTFIDEQQRLCCATQCRS